MRQWRRVSNAPDNFDNFMSFLIGAIDAVLAAQNMALAAEAEGLGICYMGTTLASCNEIGEILGCPKNVVPVTGFVIGYPDEMPAPRDRIPLTGVVHRETYRAYSDTDIKEIYREREHKGWERYRSIPELKALIDGSADTVQNLAQVYTVLKYTKESHLKYSNQVWDYLKAQDYMNF